MTEEEKNSIISAVISEIQGSSTNIADATTTQSATSKFSLIGYNENTSSMNRLDSMYYVERLKGTSNDSDSRKDPFKFIGPNTDEGYVSYDAFTDALDGLLFDNSVVGYNSGYFRARVRYCEVEIRNIVRSNQGDQLIVQVVSGAITLDSNGNIAPNNNGYKLLFRLLTKSTKGKWKEYGSTSSGGGDIDLSEYATLVDLDTKVDKVSGKGLSTNDFTTAEKTKLANIANSAEVNVQSDWNVTNTSSDAYIKNKPTFKTINGNPIIGDGDITITGGGGDINLSKYATKEEFDALAESANERLSQLETNVTDLSDVARSGAYDDLEGKPTFKTINSESILGAGNIEVTLAYPQVNHGTSDTSFTLTPNTFHVWDAVTSLSLTLGTATDGIANEYLFQFSTDSSTPTALSLPSTVMWAGGEVPQIEVMKTYQVSILNNCATLLSFG